MDFDVADDNVRDDDDHIKVLSNDKKNDIITYHESESNNESVDDRISYSFMVICNELFNDIKDNNRLSNYVVGLMLETKQIINFLMYYKKRHVINTCVFNQCIILYVTILFFAFIIIYPPFL